MFVGLLDKIIFSSKSADEDCLHFTFYLDYLILLLCQKLKAYGKGKEEFNCVPKYIRLSGSSIVCKNLPCHFGAGYCLASAVQCPRLSNPFFIQSFSLERSSIARAKAIKSFVELQHGCPRPRLAIVLFFKVEVIWFSLSVFPLPFFLQLPRPL